MAPLICQDSHTVLTCRPLTALQFLLISPGRLDCKSPIFNIPSTKALKKAVSSLLNSSTNFLVRVNVNSVWSEFRNPLPATKSLKYWLSNRRGVASRSPVTFWSTLGGQSFWSFSLNLGSMAGSGRPVPDWLYSRYMMEKQRPWPMEWVPERATRSLTERLYLPKRSMRRLALDLGLGMISFESSCLAVKLSNLPSLTSQSGPPV